MLHKLSPNQSITRWLFTKPQVTDFSGQTRPNPDNVTYRFGLKGAEPGQSPAREALAMLGPNDECALPTGFFDQLYLSGGSKNVDFSRFEFVPRLITRAFRCRVRADEAGEARFRVATCGSVRIWVGSKLVETFAPFTQNLESTKEISLILPKNSADLTIELQDLHERNTANFFSMTYLSGVSIEVGLPTVQDAALQGAADALEKMDMARVFFHDQPIALHFDKPFPVNLDLEITSIEQLARADAHESLDIPAIRLHVQAGQTELPLPHLPVLPTGCSMVTVRLVHEGIHLERRLGTTILTRGTRLLGRTIAERKKEALALLADETGQEATVAAALLATGKIPQNAAKIIASALKGIEARHDCSDFTILAILRIWQDYRSSLDPTLADRINSTILGYRYWMSEPGNDAMWFWSENHVLCFHVAQFVAGHNFQDEIFPNSGKTGAEHATEAEFRLHRWFDGMDRDGLCEWNSAAYYPIDVFALLALHDLSPDQKLRRRSARLLDQIFVMTGLHMTGGSPAGAQGRAYEKELLSGPVNELGTLAAVAFGGTWYPAYGRAALSFCLSDYEPPEIAARLAVPNKTEIIEAQYSQGVDRHGKLKLWKNSHAQLSTVSNHMVGQIGSQQHVLDAQFSSHPMARLWINHPGDCQPWSERRPSMLAGSHWLPNVAQDRNHAFAIFDVPDDPKFVAYTQLFAVADAFDKIEQLGPFVLLKAGPVTAVVWCSHPLERCTDGQYSGSLFKAHNLRTAWSVCLESTPNRLDYDTLRSELDSHRYSFDEEHLLLRALDHSFEYSGQIHRAGRPVGFEYVDSSPHIAFDGKKMRPWSEI